MTITGPIEERFTVGFSSLNCICKSGRVFVTSAVKIASTARSRLSERPSLCFVTHGRRFRSRSCESTGWRSKRFATRAT